jgi:hypothetical protein
MLVKVALLGEGLAAAKDWTHEGLLLGVTSQVIEKIVPFFETSLAPIELAQEDLGPSLAFRFKVFDIFERS